MRASRLEDFQPPLWTSLRGVSNSTAAKATVLIPLIRYLVLFNGNVVQYLNIVRELGGRDDVAVSSRLILIYLGLVNVALGVIIYSWLCPSEVKHYGSAAAYVQGDGPSLRGFPVDAITTVLSEHGPSREVLEELSSRLRQKGHESMVSDADIDGYRLEILHLYFAYLNQTHVGARVATFLFYLCGFFLLTIPSAQVFWAVAMLLIKQSH